MHTSAGALVVRSENQKGWSGDELRGRYGTSPADTPDPAGSVER